MGYRDNDELRELVNEGFFGHIKDKECPDCGRHTLSRRKSKKYPHSRYVIECRSSSCSYKEIYEYE